MLFEAFALVDRVVQFRIGVGDFLAVYKQFEALHEARFAAVFFCQRRHFHRVIDQERRLDEIGLHFFAENFVDQFGFAHRSVYFDVFFFAISAQPCFICRFHVHARIFLDGIEHGESAIGSGKLDGLFAYLHRRSAFRVNGAGHTFEHFFGHVHHPVVVLVRHVEFQGRELRVVGTVHAFVAEHFSKFVHPVEAGHDQALQVQFVGDTQVQLHIQRVVVRYERACRRAAMNRL